MPTSLAKEQTILVSNEGFVTLTTHRVIHKSRNFNKQLMLNEFVSYEIIKRRSQFLKRLTISLALLVLCLGIGALIIDQQRVNIIERIRYGGNEMDEKFDIIMSLLGIVGGMLVISLILLAILTKRYLKIIGRFGDIEFPLNKFSNTSLEVFVENLLRESENRRKE